MRRQEPPVSFSEIAKVVGSTKDAVQKRYSKIQGYAEGLTTETLDISRLIGFTPVSLPNPGRLEVKTGPIRRILVSSDWHFGAETYDERCEAIHLEVARQWKPDLIVLNGDLPDLLAVSKYPKDVRTVGPLQTEIRLMHEFLYRLCEAVPDTRIVETNANHSGEGTESRWWRYLSERIPEVLEVESLRAKFSYRSIFHPEWSKVEVLDYVPLAPGLIALHGDLIRSQSGYSAKAMLEKWRVSLIHGHTHRFGSHWYRVPAVAGKREHQMRAYEGACMCSLKPHYTAMSNWQQGFCCVTVGDSGRFSVEEVCIEDGQAVVGVLGQTIKGG